MTEILNLKSKNSVPAPQSRRYWLVGVGIVLFLGFLIYMYPQNERAVFLVNNQVYFGKFRYIPFSSTITLRDVYYLQVSQGIQPPGNNPNTELKIVKLGNEIHGPKNKMVIPKTQIAFYEDLRSDSLVLKAIADFKKSAP